MTSFSVFLKCCKEGTFWAGTMKYSMLPLFSPALAPRFFLYFIDLKNKPVYMSFNKKRVLLISGMSAWDECWVVRLLYSSSWWGSLVVCVCGARLLSFPPSFCMCACVCVCLQLIGCLSRRETAGRNHTQPCTTKKPPSAEREDLHVNKGVLQQRPYYSPVISWTVSRLLHDRKRTVINLFKCI